MRWKCTCAFDGTSLNGWQSQADGSGVQDVVEKRLAAILGGFVRVHGSSRTDAGVHARRFVFHFDASWRHGPEALLAAFRTGLPPSIVVHAARTVPASFHARHSATAKRYVYYVHEGYSLPFDAPYRLDCPYELDTDAMAAAAARLVGRHRFRAVSAGRRPEENTVRHLRRLDVTRKGRLVRITGEADGFLYKMMRSLAGALVCVGSGKLSPDRVGKLLKGRRRTPEIPTAAARGLFLERVLYK